MKYCIQCPYDECNRVFLVPWESSNRLMKCPHCSKTVFCDRLAQLKFEDDTLPPESVPLPLPEGPITKIELQCVGTAGGGYIFSQCTVMWFHIAINHESKTVQVKEHRIPIGSYSRVNLVNVVWFDVPENVICYYRRHAQVKPSIEETRYFWVKDGQFIDFGEQTGVLAFDFPKRFLSEYKRYTITMSSRDE
jgi:hypothetical protein